MSGRAMVLILACAALAAGSLGCDTTTDENSNAIVIHNANANTGNIPAEPERPLKADISREEYERDKDYYEREARRLGRKVGQGASDLWLWTKTRSALAYADDLRDVTINVDVENEVVTLTGSVGSEAQKSKAAQIAGSLEGVRSVTNNLTVGGR